jgi:hypothetical protein
VLPVCVAVNVHVPAVAPVVTEFPEIVHAPEATTVTVNPELAVAEIVKVVFTAADAGAPVSEIVCEAS